MVAYRQREPAASATVGFDQHSSLTLPARCGARWQEVTTAMTALKGIIHNGQVQLPAPADWPDGTEVTVLAHGPAGTLGIPDDEWPTEPDALAQLLARMDRVEPLETTAAEEADLAAWREKVKQVTLAKQAATIEGLFE